VSNDFFKSPVALFCCMLELAAKILKHNVCEHCLGRQFGQLGSGFNNAERGKALRTSVALAIDSHKKFDVDPNNFAGYRFRQNQEFEKLPKEKKACEVCNGLFENLDKLAERVAKQTSKYEFENFLVGTQISDDLLKREEKLWESVGIDYTEPLRGELNREIGKRLEKLTGKRADLKKPNITVLLDLEKNKVIVTTNPLFVFGGYEKIKRGIPQSKWGTPHKYPTSIEEEIGKPLLKLTGGKDTKFHGMGREDIDALCLDWRPFVIEIEKPIKRVIDFKKLQKLVAKNKKVLVSQLKISDMETVRKIKAAAPDKTYRALVQLGKPVKQSDLKKLKSLVGQTIQQKTPNRVLHRRADLQRKRVVKGLKWKMKGKSLEIVVQGSAGLYIKELISGDEGRTKPSVSEILGVPAKVKELDVIKIGKIKL